MSLTSVIPLHSQKDHDYALMAERCRRSFAAFVKHFWKVTVPKTLIWNWHFDAICDHLQAVTEGSIRKLIINVPPGHGKCVKESSYVELIDGTHKQIKDIVPGDRVVSSDGISVTSDRVVAVQRSGVKKLIKITLSDGQELILTRDHKIYGWDSWNKAGDLSVGDPVCVTEILPFGGVEIPRNDAFLLGVWFANGHKDASPYVVTNGSEEINRRLVEIADSRGWSHNYVTPLRLDLGGFRKQIGDTPVNFMKRYDIFHKFTSHNIRVPREIFQADRESVSEFIGSYFACDGTVSKPDGSRTVSASSASKMFLFDIKTLLLKFGIRSTLRYKKAKCNGKFFDSWILQISGRSQVESFYENINIYHKQESVKKLVDSFPVKSSTWSVPPEWRDSLKRSKNPFYVKGVSEALSKTGWSDTSIVLKVCDLHGDNELPKKLTSGLGWRKVESIEEFGEENTYDIQTEKHNAFFCDTALTHNSTVVAVLWPAWEWIDHPGEQSLFGSYDIDLALRDSVKCRQVFDSQLYRDVFQPSWKMNKDQNAKGFYTNTANGNRYTFGLLAGGNTGWRGDKMVIDDPNSVKARFDTRVKREAFDIFNSVLSTRINDIARSKFVIIQQRVAYDDFTGKLNEEGGYETLLLKEEFEPSKRYFTSIGWTDPRKEDGELLFPTLFPPKELIYLRDKKLGPEGYSAQYQQEPFPAGGRRFDSDLFVYYHRVGRNLVKLVKRNGTEEIHSLDHWYTFVSVDLAASEEASADWTVFSIWAVNPKSADMILLNRHRGRWSEPKIIEKSIEIYAFVGYNGKKHLAFIVEDNGLGLPISQEMLKSGLPVIPVHIHRTDKTVRSTKAKVIVDAGKVYFPAYLPPAPHHPWMEEWVRELTEFPAGEHDDQVDTLSLAAEGVFSVGFAGLVPGETISPTKKQAHEVMEGHRENVKLGKRFFKK